MRKFSIELLMKYLHFNCHCRPQFVDTGGDRRESRVNQISDDSHLQNCGLTTSMIHDRSIYEYFNLYGQSAGLQNFKILDCIEKSIRCARQMARILVPTSGPRRSDIYFFQDSMFLTNQTIVILSNLRRLTTSKQLSHC